MSTPGRRTPGLRMAVPTPEELFSPAEVYHENSKLGPGCEELFQRIGAVNESPHIRGIISRPFRTYPGCVHVDLPQTQAVLRDTLPDLLRSRRSCHDFAGTPISRAQLGSMLALGDGIVAVQRGPDPAEFQLRTAPSGGGLYPVETFCLVMDVEGMEPGVYHYDVLRHRLAHVKAMDCRTALLGACNLHAELRGAAVCFALSVVLPRSSFKYGQRAYRFALIESGHIAQNLLLAAEAHGLGSLPVGGFFDDDLNRLVGLDGCQEFVVYLALAGHRCAPGPAVTTPIGNAATRQGRDA